MRTSRSVAALLASAACMAIAGCTGDASPAGSARRRPAWGGYTPPPDRVVTSTLLSFESASDLAFVRPVSGEPPTVVVDPVSPANHVLRLDARSGCEVGLGSLMRGREFPGPWDMVGVRYYKVNRQGVAHIDLTRVTEGLAMAHARAQVLPPAAGTWHTLWLPIERASAAAATSPSAADAYRLTCAVDDGDVLLIDDLTLAQSHAVAAESAVPETMDRWLVRRNGEAWEFVWGNQVLLTAPAAPFREDGYSIVEADPTRVLLQSPVLGTLAVNRLGRVIRDGAVADEPTVGRVAKAGGEATPKVEIAGNVVNDDGSRDDGNAGRVERTLPGDRDNDGYDETRGCAVVRAQGRRINVRLSSRGGAIRWPVLEVRDLPAGNVNVYVEGQTVPWATRLRDGRVVIELPITLAGEVDVQVRVR